MSEVLYEWLKKRWMYDNHKKYHKYFDMWVQNITEVQKDYFEKQRTSLIEGSKIISNL